MAKTTKTTTKTPAPSAQASAAGVATATKAAAPNVSKTIATAPAAPATKSAGSTCCGGSTTCSTPSYEQIAQRAFEIWVAKGRPQGQDIENWKQAEGELTKGKLVTAA